MLGKELIKWINNNDLGDTNVELLLKTYTGEYSDPDYVRTDDFTLQSDEGNITIEANGYITN